MPQFAVFVVPSVPAVGGTVTAQVYRGDAPDVTAAIDEAVAVLAIARPMKVWAVPVAQLTPFRVDVQHTRAVVAE